MNILICIETLNTGGAETFAQNLIKESSFHSRNKTFVFITNPSRIILNNFKLNNVKYFVPKDFSNNRFIYLLGKLFFRSNFLNEFQFIYQFFYFNFVIIYYRIDHVNSHLFKTDFKILKYFFLLKRKWSIVMHGCYEDYLYINEGNIDINNLRCFNQIFKLVDIVYYPAIKNTESFLYANSIPTSSKINYGIFPFSGEKISLDFSGKDFFVLGMVSRGIVEKGWELGINAFLEFKSKYKVDAKLVLVYSESNYMTNLKTRYSSVEDIIFHGYSSDPRSLMYNFDLLLFPSFFKSESQPVTIIEALQCGLPVFSTDIGDVPNMLNFNGLKGGLVFSLDHFSDKEFIADRINEFFSNKIQMEKFRSDSVLISENYSISSICRLIFD